MPVISSGQYLTNAQMGIFPNMVKLTTSGSWTVPANVTLARVRLKGGGGGSSATDFGGDGFERDEVISVVPGGSIVVVIGAGGNSGVAGGDSAITGGLSAKGGLSGAQAKAASSAGHTGVWRRSDMSGPQSAGFGIGGSNMAGTNGIVEIWY